jgi:hypothetical protein
MTVKIRLPGEPLYWVILVVTMIAGIASVPALPFDGVLPTPPLNDDLQHWGKDPFIHPPDPTSIIGNESSGSFVELRGVIAGPSGVVAILNHDIVRVGDHVNGEIVVEITPSAVVLKRGQQVRRVVIRSFALP